jgi:hypothetical protein
MHLVCIISLEKEKTIRVDGHDHADAFLCDILQGDQDSTPIVFNK